MDNVCHETLAPVSGPWQTPAGMASLADISRRAGTSVATASRVLNGSTHPVSEATRARVLAAAEDLGYAPSALAQALVSRSSRIIGVIVNDIVDPYFAEIARGVEDVAGRSGHLVMVCNADHRIEAEIEYVRALRDYHAEGLVFAGSGAPGAGGPNALLAREVEAARARGGRVVCLAQRDFPGLRLSVDNTAAVRDLTEHLIGLGHRRVAFVEGPPELYTSADRLAGFRAAMGAARLAGDLRFPGGFDFEAGQAAARAVLDAGPLPDAIVAANDEAAIGVVTVLRQAGLDVPGDVSVAGIDDTRPARFVDLTTVSLPLYDLGAGAARHILAGAGAPQDDAHERACDPHDVGDRGVLVRRVGALQAWRADHDARDAARGEVAHVGAVGGARQAGRRAELVADGRLDEADERRVRRRLCGGELPARPDDLGGRAEPVVRCGHRRLQRRAGGADRLADAHAE